MRSVAVNVPRLEEKVKVIFAILLGLGTKAIVTVIGPNGGTVQLPLTVKFAPCMAHCEKLNSVPAD